MDHLDLLDQSLISATMPVQPRTLAGRGRASRLGLAVALCAVLGAGIAAAPHASTTHAAAAHGVPAIASLVPPQDTLGGPGSM